MLKTLHTIIHLIYSLEEDSDKHGTHELEDTIRSRTIECKRISEEIKHASKGNATHNTNS